MARLVSAFRRETVSPDGMFRFEKELESLLREVGRLIMEWTVNRLEPADRDEMPQLFLWMASITVADANRLLES